jgi:hypothetical protein
MSACPETIRTRATIALPNVTPTNETPASSVREDLLEVVPVLPP